MCTVPVRPSCPPHCALHMVHYNSSIQGSTEFSCGTQNLSNILSVGQFFVPKLFPIVCHSLYRPFRHRFHLSVEVLSVEQGVPTVP